MRYRIRLLRLWSPGPPDSIATVTREETRSWKPKGFYTVACNGGEEALVAPGTMKPDLILPDIMMELKDGWETPGKIKADR